VAAELVVVFDLSPSAQGAYYVTGDVVWHQDHVCVVQSTVRLDGTRFRAYLRVATHPTPEQRRAAEEWRRRFGPPIR
jgi:hypothetical protein